MLFLFFFLLLITSNNLIESFVFNKLINRIANKINFDQNKKKCNENKYLILNKQNKFYDHTNITDYINENLYNNLTISISPGGVKGFYLLGTCCFIKENYKLKNYIFTGASAGSWNSLLMSYKGNLKNIINLIHELDYDNIKSLYELELNLKQLILKNFNNDEFQLNKLFIGVTIFKKFKFKTYIFTDFDNLEDAIDCCIASSHIPFITGNFLYKYKDLYCFDGGFSKNPYFDFIRKAIHITPTIWKNIIMNDNLEDNAFSFDKVKIIKLYFDGYDDAKKNNQIIKELIGQD